MDRLAIYGGTPVFTGEWPRWPQWGAREEENLIAALNEGQWGTLGKRALAFADRFAAYAGVRHAIAINTGTQALEILLRGAGIGRGDEVIVPAYTFAATVAAVANVGVTPVFADVDQDTGCLDAHSVEGAVTGATRAILAVHIAGRPFDLDALIEVAKRRGLLFLEDAAHAHGSEWRGQKVGSLGDAAAFSFQSSKTLTGGEGGMIATDDEAIFEVCWRWHNSGRPRAGGQLIGGDVGMGTNGRMAEWQAAILDAQMDRLDDQNARRERSAARLSEAIKDLPCLRLPPLDPRVTRNGYFLYQFRLNPEALKADRAEFLRALNAEGVPASAGYTPLYKMNMLRGEDYRRRTGREYSSPDGRLPNTDALCATAVWLPGRVLLAGDAEVDAIAQAIRKAADAFAR